MVDKEIYKIGFGGIHNERKELFQFIIKVNITYLVKSMGDEQERR